MTSVTPVPPPLANVLPVLQVSVGLKDANGHDVASVIGVDIHTPLITFYLANFNAGQVAQFSSADALGTGLLSSVKQFLTSFDWTSYGAATWSSYGIPTPVTMKQVTVTRWDAATTDITPA